MAKKWNFVVHCLSLLVVNFANENVELNFVSNPNTKYISSNVLMEKDVCSMLECGHLCLRMVGCVSFNLEKQINDNKMKCELLAEYQRKRKDLLQQNDKFDHYFTTDPCSQLKCFNGGSCVMSQSGYRCSCVNNYVGTICETPVECIQHTNWTTQDHNINYGLVSRKCDNTLTGWVRYVGSAGSRMLDYCPTGGQRCNTDFQGWIETQPSTGEVRVERKICWQGNNNCCNWPTTIVATNCGEFVVYRVTKVNGCYLRYCGRD